MTIRRAEIRVVRYEVRHGPWVSVCMFVCVCAQTGRWKQHGTRFTVKSHFLRAFIFFALSSSSLFTFTSSGKIGEEEGK